MNKDDNVVQLNPVVQPEQIKSLTEIPDFITRVDISRMNDQQLEQLIAGVRLRRMAPINIYETTRKEKEKVLSETLGIKMDKRCDMILKKINAIDKHFEQLEQHVEYLRGLRIQANLEFI